MAKGPNQKLKMLYLLQIFMRYTDDQHALSMREIIGKLEECGVNADRKTVYQDLEQLINYGVDILHYRLGSIMYYHLGNRQFELAELKLLVDSVQAAKFITDHKSQSLIAKLSTLVSEYEGRQLQRQVVLNGRIKTINKSIYNNVDTIYTAIDQGKQISFHYFQWDVEGKQILRHAGALYQISPWCLMWDDEYYYLVAFDSISQQIKHYRVDKMLDLTICEQVRLGQETFDHLDLGKYSKSLFGMYGGEPCGVTLECHNDIAGIIIDRFGLECPRIQVGENHFHVRVNIVPSRQFLGWLMSLNSSVKVIRPPEVVSAMQEEVRRLASMYLQN